MSLALQQHERGFTLVELLLYFALCSIMLAVLGSIGINVLSSRVKVHSQEEVRYHGMYSIDILREFITSSDGVIAPISTATSSTLTLAMPDILRNPTVITFEGGMIVVQEGEMSSWSLLPDAVEVVDLTFSNMSVPDGTDSIGIDLSIKTTADSQRYTASSSFKTTVTKRIGS